MFPAIAHDAGYAHLIARVLPVLIGRLSDLALHLFRGDTILELLLACSSRFPAYFRERDIDVDCSWDWRSSFRLKQSQEVKVCHCGGRIAAGAVSARVRGIYNMPALLNIACDIDPRHGRAKPR